MYTNINIFIIHDFLNDISNLWITLLVLGLNLNVLIFCLGVPGCRRTREKKTLKKKKSLEGGFYNREKDETAGKGADKKKQSTRITEATQGGEKKKQIKKKLTRKQG